MGAPSTSIDSRKFPRLHLHPEPIESEPQTAAVDTEPNARLDVVRVYLRGRTMARPGLLGWLFPKQLAREVVQSALRFGADYATVSLGQMGFVAGARELAEESVEVEVGTLPCCIELVGRRSVLERVLYDQRMALKGALVIWGA